MSERFTIKREVEIEAGREYVWWTVFDNATGYNKTFRTEAEAQAHAADIQKGNLG